jgi:hypothetical protein
VEVCIFQIKTNMIVDLLILTTILSIMNRVHRKFDMMSGLPYQISITLLEYAVIPEQYYIFDWSEPPPKILHVVYGLQLCYYLSSLIMDHKWIEGVMKLHHMTTIAAICTSWYHNKMQVGLLVMIIHNFSDIFLYIIRLCRTIQGYTDEHGDHNRSLYSNRTLFWSKAITAITLPLLLFLWYELRILYLFQIICASYSLYEHGFGKTIGIICLSILWCIHIHWLGLILQKTFMLGKEIYLRLLG